MLALYPTDDREARMASTHERVSTQPTISSAWRLNASKNLAENYRPFSDFELIGFRPLYFFCFIQSVMMLSRIAKKVIFFLRFGQLMPLNYIHLRS